MVGAILERFVRTVIVNLIPTSPKIKMEQEVIIGIISSMKKLRLVNKLWVLGSSPGGCTNLFQYVQV